MFSLSYIMKMISREIAVARLRESLIGLQPWLCIIGCATEKKCVAHDDSRCYCPKEVHRHFSTVEEFHAG
jgi:hypothetical protein